MSFSRLEDAWWEGMVARLPRPLSDEEAAMDLRYHAGQVRRHVATQGQRGRHRMPGRRTLATRWGWDGEGENPTDYDARKLMKAEHLWADPHASGQLRPLVAHSSPTLRPLSAPKPAKSQEPVAHSSPTPRPLFATRAVLTDTQVHRGTPQRESERSATTSRATGEPEAPPPTPAAGPGLGSLSRDEGLIADTDAHVDEDCDDAPLSALPTPEAAPTASTTTTATTPWYQNSSGVTRCRGCAAKQGTEHGSDCRYAPAPPKPEARGDPEWAPPFGSPLSRPPVSK